MPKLKPITLNLNLLKPQSNPEKLALRLIRWLLSTGHYIFVVVNGLVLIAFISRFKLDADLASRKEAIEEQIPYIESLAPYEILIRETQLKLETNDNVKRNSPDWPVILKKIAELIPLRITITDIKMERSAANSSIHINGQTESNNDLSSFITGLKSDKTFSEVTLVSVGLEQGIIKFSLDASAPLTNLGGKSL